MIMQQISAGVLAGAALSFAGAAKNSAKGNEPFDLKKLFDSVLTGAVVGFIGGVVGADQETIADFGGAVVMYGGATQLFRHLSKAVITKTSPYWKSVVRRFNRK